ncbi:MAG: hypothetical protein H0V88_11290 [Pyrinomonadaceae bacterium]|nr:hypothetical protein [Pyrinomonadaceae bacterium]
MRQDDWTYAPLTITPEVTSNDFSCSFMVDVFDMRNNPVTSAAIIATHRNSEVGATRRIRLVRRQNMIMRLKFDGNAERFRVRLGGAIDLPYASVDARDPVDVPVRSTSTRGTLRIEMDNGSIQEFNLDRVRQVTVRP